MWMGIPLGYKVHEVFTEPGITRYSWRVSLHHNLQLFKDGFPRGIREPTKGQFTLLDRQEKGLYTFSYNAIREMYTDGLN